MQQNFAHKSILVIAVIVVAALLICALPVQAFGQAAQTAGFSITGANHPAQAVFPVSVQLNSNDIPVNVIAVELKYDPSKLKLISAGDPPVGLIDLPHPPQFSDGSVLITRVSDTYGSLQGKVSVARLQFRALASSGSAMISVGSRTQVYATENSVDVWDGSSVGSTISFHPAHAPKSSAVNPGTHKPSSVTSKPVATTANVLAQQATVSTGDNSSTVAPREKQLATVSIIGTNTADSAITTSTALLVVATLAICACALRYISRQFHQSGRKRSTHA